MKYSHLLTMTPSEIEARIAELKKALLKIEARVAELKKTLPEIGDRTYKEVDSIRVSAMKSKPELRLICADPRQQELTAINAMHARYLRELARQGSALDGWIGLSL